MTETSNLTTAIRRPRATAIRASASASSSFPSADDPPSLPPSPPLLTLKLELVRTSTGSKSSRACARLRSLANSRLRERSSVRRSLHRRRSRALANDDLSQRDGGVHGPDMDAREKSELIGASRPSDKKVEAWHLTPRAARGGKTHSEPSSAQSTPARAAGSRASLAGAMVGCAGSRGNDLTGHRRMSLYSGASRGFQIANAETWLEVPHFELEENSTCRDECGVRLSSEEAEADAEAEEEEEALERLAFRQPLPTGTFLMVPPWVQ
ncbi:hypothetical protein NL676_034630 [Syzygium grande]|nr:hypothetical protein NL676_034630 [Syzygium grande]